MNFQKKLNEGTSVSYEAKVYAIFNNYCKHCKIASKDMIKRPPKHQ